MLQGRAAQPQDFTVFAVKTRTLRRICAIIGTDKGQPLHRKEAIQMEELLEIYDEALRPLGRAEREEAHQKGLLHQVVHCWAIGTREEQPVLYMQQRAADKETFPLLYDIAVGGHIRAGETPLEGLAREAREEMGISLEPGRLRYIGAVRQTIPLPHCRDRELAQVYLYDAGQGGFHPGPELERMVWVQLNDARELAMGLRESIVVTDDRTGKWEETGLDQWRPLSGEFLELVWPQIQEMKGEAT